VKTTDVQQIGQALNVGGVIDGTVRRYGNRLKLTAQLTDASSGKLMWADSYEQEAQDVFTVEDSIAKAIVAALKVRLSPADAKAAGVTNAQGTADAAAYDFYLRAKYLLGRRGTYLYSALNLFEQATKRDPNFARAYAGYAMTASLVPVFTRTSADSIIPLGMVAARRAIQIDPDLPEAHLGLGNLLLFNYEWEQARAEYKRAIELDPLNATAHQWAGDVMYAIGRPLEGLADMKRAVELDPSSPIIHTDYGYALMISGRYPEARAQLAKSMELDSGLVFNESNLLIWYYSQGMYDSVIVADHRKARLMSATIHVAALRKKGDIAAANKLADSVHKAISAPRVDDDGSIHSMLFAVTGQPDSAFRYLNLMVDKKSGTLFSGGVTCWPLYDSLHSDPRWDQILKRHKAIRCQR
jgi:serine/threonine-protein kinase